MTWDPDWRAWPSWQMIFLHPVRSIRVRFWGPNGRFQLRKHSRDEWRPKGAFVSLENFTRERERVERAETVLRKIRDRHSIHSDTNSRDTCLDVDAALGETAPPEEQSVDCGGYPGPPQ